MLDLASQAAKQKTAPLFPLAAPLSENGIGFVPSTLAENSHPGSEGKPEPRVGPWVSVSSTSHWAYPLCSYESTSARLDQRYYNANQGRFWTPDPAGMGAADSPNPGSWNLYAYALGDPVNRRDPRGLSPVISCRWVEGPEGMDLVCDNEASTDGPRSEPEASTGTEGPSVQMFAVSATVTSGPVTFHNVVKAGAQYDVVQKDLVTLKGRLDSDPDCLGWLQSGTGAYKLDSSWDESKFVGVASSIEQDGNNAPQIAAMSNISPTLDIVINAQGAFFYGGNMPGINTPIAGNSESGQLLILLHELAHVTHAGLAEPDGSASVNAGNNTIVWNHCQKTILGK